MATATPSRSGWAPARPGVDASPAAVESAMLGSDLRHAGDTALVVAIGRWREDALAESYRRHGGAVYSLARRVLGDDSRAEEVTQEVFLRLWQRPERFDP